MKGLVADANFEGQLDRIATVLNSSEWRDVWQSVNMELVRLEQIGLTTESKDWEIWSTCQRLGYFLVTGNRNQDGPDSLNLAILSGAGDSLPVFTIGDANRMMIDAAYALIVTINLLECLIDLRDHPERILGAGRIYLPHDAS